ncbi:hypothetical protein PRECH8_23540 [Insulibacter thermoxylanivorax]|uniref:Uncharacterized protein n=1 Tax=Insulibacter thermoxylanivorax TaxID=2749268 RepID=A0A916QGK1_9BACL|nr:hypothetical protein PRECH8_23540 [Insulibacter thermoxylanivorax]
MIRRMKIHYHLMPIQRCYAYEVQNIQQISAFIKLIDWEAAYLVDYNKKIRIRS